MFQLLSGAFGAVPGSCRTIWLRPERFATRSASSARRRAAAISSSGSISVIPKLEVNLGSPPTVMAASSRARTVFKARVASTAEQSGKAMVNSSPP